MVIDKVPFRRYDQEKKTDTFTVWLSKEERTHLNICKEILEQPKDSTALKQLAWLGAKLLVSPQMMYAFGTVFKNKRKNKRMGIINFEE